MLSNVFSLFSYYGEVSRHGQFVKFYTAVIAQRSVIECNFSSLIPVQHLTDLVTYSLRKKLSPPIFSLPHPATIVAQIYVPYLLIDLHFTFFYTIYFFNSANHNLRLVFIRSAENVMPTKKLI